MLRSGKSRLLAAVASASLVSLPVGPSAKPLSAAGGEPVSVGGPPGFRRLNEGQYVRSIAQVFGPSVKVPGRFDPPVREQGLLAIGDGAVAVSPSGLEQYEARAHDIAAQVFAHTPRATLVPCATPQPEGFDARCASDFLAKYGRLLYRRPLTDEELAPLLATTRTAAVQSHSFDRGLEAGLARLLMSPKFIFRVERASADPQNPAVGRLDAYSLAGRISFLLWDAPPDATLLDAAGRGDLEDPKKLAAQVDRLIASPRFEQGVRSFFSDMFGFDQFTGLAKDQSIYPKFSSDLAKDAQEQALRTIVDLLVTQKGDYRDLFTTRKTFINRNLGALYQVPVDVKAAGGDWQPYVFPASAPRAGILTLPGFLMLDPTHEGRSSPTIRGKTVRELFLCQQVPPPPPNVDISAVQNTGDLVHRTARERLTVHRAEPECAGCHKLTDPIGLSMENYDATGAYRTHENGALIDASGEFDGHPYQDALGLEMLLHDSPTAAACVVERTYEYGVGRPLTKSEQPWVDYAAKQFAADKYRFAALMRRIATSPAFRSVSLGTAAPAVKVAAAK